MVAVCDSSSYVVDYFHSCNTSLHTSGHGDAVVCDSLDSSAIKTISTLEFRYSSLLYVSD